jgi:hypothetical protein
MILNLLIDPLPNGHIDAILGPKKTYRTLVVASYGTHYHHLGFFALKVVSEEEVRIVMLDSTRTLLTLWQFEAFSSHQS